MNLDWKKLRLEGALAGSWVLLKEETGEGAKPPFSAALQLCFWYTCCWTATWQWRKGVQRAVFPVLWSWQKYQTWMEIYQLSYPENTCSDSRPEAPCSPSGYIEASVGSLTCFIRNRASWNFPSPQYCILQRSNSVPCTDEVCWGGKMPDLLWPLSKKLSLWSTGYWYHHLIYINIWSWPFLSFYGPSAGYSCLVTNCRSCLDENYKSPALNFNWGQIKGKKLGVAFFHGLEIYIGYLEAVYLGRQR